MATTKKYVSLDKLTIYDEKIKALIDTKDAEQLAAAKSYADGLATNYDAAGSAATALADAKTYADGKDAAIAAAKKAGDDAAAAAAVADGKAVTAQAAADAAAAAAAAAQGDVDALEAYVGTIPEGATATDVVSYVQEKTSGIATDAALSELQAQVTTNKNNIATIQGDYLKAVDKTELSDSIGAVDAKVDVLVGADTDKSVRKIANEELVAQLIPEAAKESLDTLQEIAAWIQSHPDDASAMSAAIDALESLVGTIPTEGVTATNIVAYIQELVAAENSRATTAESGISDRVSTLEGKFGEGDGSVADMIATAKQEAIDTAATDATTKANAAQSAAESTAKTYTDTEVGKDRTRLDALEASAHTHDNKGLLDTYTQTEESLADAVAKKHEHSNKTVIDGITAENINTWNTVTSKAAQSDLDAAVARIAANESNIASFVEVSEEEINNLFASV